MYRRDLSPYSIKVVMGWLGQSIAPSFPLLGFGLLFQVALANVQNAEEVPVGPLPRESLMKAIRGELEETLVSHAVVPRVSWVKRRGLSCATDGWEGLSGTQTRRNHFSFCKMLQEFQNRAGL